MNWSARLLVIGCLLINSGLSHAGQITKTSSVEIKESLLLDNPDFEAGSPQHPDRPKGWEPLTGLKLPQADPEAIYLWDNAVSSSGSRSLKIIKSKPEKIAGWIQQVPCSKPGGRYQISAWVKTEGITGRPGARSGAHLTLQFAIGGLDKSLIYEGPFVAASQDWRHLKLVFVVPEGCTGLSIILGLEGAKGTVWWDKVALEGLQPRQLSGLTEVRMGEIDKYGGYKKIKGKATGFFHTEKLQGRWWIITPAGHGFIAVGLQHMSRRTREANVIEHVKNIPTNKFNMAERYHTLSKLTMVTAEQLKIDPGTLLSPTEMTAIKNLINVGNILAPQRIDEVYKRIGGVINNSAAQSQWLQASTRKVKEWGFNTISHNTLFKGLAYDLPVSPSLWGFPFINPEIRVPAAIGVPGIDPHSKPYDALSFPDVFDPKFKEILVKEFQKTAVRVHNDPYLLGYYLANELAWGGNPFCPSPDLSLLDIFFALPPQRPGKKALVEFLQQRYNNNVSLFNNVWGTKIKDFKALQALNRLGPGIKDVICYKDRSDFLRLVAEIYFKTNYEIIKKNDPHHLIMGTRFISGQPVPPEVLETMGKYVDIVSYNAYESLPPLEMLEDSYKIHQKPMIISEFSFKAADSGLPNTLGQGFTWKTQKDRALWYERYVCQLLSSPNIVGFVWYKDSDDGHSRTGENCNYGLMTYNELPYDDLVKKVRDINHKIYQLAVQ